MLALVYGLVEAAETTWLSAHSWGPLGLGGLLLIGFIVHEARAAAPLLPLRLFDSRVRSGAYAARVLFLAGMIGFWFYLTQDLQGVLDMAWLAQLGPQGSYLANVAWPMVVLGVGQGLTLSPLTIAGVAGVRAQDAGAASGLVNAAHQLGGSFGLAWLVVVFSASAHPGTGSVTDSKADLAHRVANCLGTSAVLLALSLVTVLLFVLQKRAARGHDPVVLTSHGFRKDAS